MDRDQDLLESFLEEITGLNLEILGVLKALSENLNQPEEFLKFSNIIDRIYGTAMTLELNDLGKYCGELKTISRMTGNSDIARARQPVYKLMLNYTANFKALKESIIEPEKNEDFLKSIKVDLIKIENLKKEVFVYADKKCGIIKS